MVLETTGRVGGLPYLLESTETPVRLEASRRGISLRLSTMPVATTGSGEFLARQRSIENRSFIMAYQESGTIAVLAEKPSVARDIARELGATSRGDGYLHGNRYVVTWAVGHLVSLAQPHEINEERRHGRRDLLPDPARRWPLVVYENTKDQFEVVERILNSPRVSRVVCATDAGREGELIFRYIYESTQCRKPFSRLWISSLTPEAIRNGFAALRPGADYDSLADAARGRSRADWLVGMNLSRAYSLAYNEEISVGRVQTPTLAMVVERELAIRRFVPEDYLEIVADFRPSGECSTGGAQQKSIAVRGSVRGRERAPTGNRCRRRCGCPPMEKKPSAFSSARTPVRHAIDSIQSERSAWLPAVLRSNRTPAARQPPVRLQRAENAGCRTGAV